MKKIVASILSADFSHLGEEVAAVARAGADWIHVDVMDGHFVPNLTMGPMTVETVRSLTDIPIDAHLMIENPDDFIERFAAAGASHICVHAESVVHLNRSLQLVRSCGSHPGIALGPAGSLSLIEWSLEYADYVNLVAVNPGFGGQGYIPNVLDKVRALRAEIARRGLPTVIESDGGINADTIADFSAAGVDAFIMGSAIFESDDYAAAIAELRAAAESERATKNPREYRGAKNPREHRGARRAQ